MIKCETTEYLFVFISQAVLSDESKHVLLYLSRLWCFHSSLVFKFGRSEEMWQ